MAAERFPTPLTSPIRIGTLLVSISPEGANGGPTAGTGRTVQIAISGEIDMATADRLGDALVQIMQEYRPARLEVDLAGVPFLDSVGVRAFVRGILAGRQQGCRIVVSSPRSVVYRVLEITGLAPELGLAPGQRPDPQRNTQP